MKNKLKVTEKLLDSLGLGLKVSDLPEDACIKRMHIDDAISEVSPHEGDRYSVGTITTIDVDSDGDVVLPSGLDTKRYEKNPVVLFQHNLNMPVGYAEKLVFNDDRVIAKTRYASTAEATKVHQLVKDRVLRTHSIGFITMAAEPRGSVAFDMIMADLQAKFPERFNEQTSKKVDRIVTKALMVEYSIVTIPANEEAVINEVKSAHHCKVEREAPEADPKQEEAAEDRKDAGNSAIEIKVVKRASCIKKIDTAKDREQRKLRGLYLSLWGA